MDPTDATTRRLLARGLHLYEAARLDESKRTRAEAAKVEGELMGWCEAACIAVTGGTPTAAFLLLNDAVTAVGPKPTPSLSSPGSSDIIRAWKADVTDRMVAALVEELAIAEARLT
jgi:hypothetical protein